MAEPQNSPRIRVFVVDGHPGCRKGLISLIRAEPDLEVCGEAGTAKAALRFLESHRPDIVSLEIALPDLRSDGIDLIEKITAQCQQLPILVLSSRDENAFAMRALQAGARGYLMKSEASASVLAALRKMGRGEVSVSPRFGQQLIYRTLSAVGNGEPSVLNQLTPREREVLERSGEGMGTRQISETLKLSVKTVETHRAHVKEKLACRDMEEMVRFAVDWREVQRGQRER